MVRKILTIGIGMTGGYPIDGKPKEKTEKMHPEIWKRYAIFFAVIAMALTVVVAYFAFSTQTPAKTSQDASTEVKTEEVQPAENAVVNAATGAVVIPEDALVGVLSGTQIFPVDKFPKNVYVEFRHTLIKDIRITDTVITGIAINTKQKDGDLGQFSFGFYKGNDEIGRVYVNDGTGNSRESGYTGKAFKVDRPLKTLGADGIAMQWQ